MQDSGQIILNLKSVDVTLAEISYIILVVREYATSVEFNAQLSILLANLHAHSLIEIEYVLLVNAL